MVTTTSVAKAGADTDAPPVRVARLASIDALRGLVMFTMIFVNDLAGAPEKIVPPWLKHFHGQSGMTFVDLVFPAFLFIVGMSIPFALGARSGRGEPLWKTVRHIIIRTLSLLLIGILMVNETPSTEKMGWSGTLWCALMYLSAILAFCAITPRGKADSTKQRQQLFRIISIGVSALGFASLTYLAFAFRGEDGHAIISLQPFSIHAEWYGILGLIGWAYLVGAIVFLAFRTHRTALLGCMALLMCLFPAEKTGAFNGFWLSHYVGIGVMLGSHAAITVAGDLLATILITPGTATVPSRVRFTLLFISGCAAAAWLLQGLYGINKNSATPAWCFWACAITGTVWLLFYFLSDVQSNSLIARPFVIAGQNVLLAYLISELLPSASELFHLGNWYDGLAGPHLFNAVTRSAGCALIILSVSAALNRLGFRLKL